MPEQNLRIDPDELRRLAAEHAEVAARTREWGKKPAEWLGQFEATYGKIADPVNKALNKYYDARERAAIALAVEHENTRDKLLEAANRFVGVDEEGAKRIRTISGEDGAGPGAGTPMTNRPYAMPGTNGTQPGLGAPESATPGATGQQQPQPTPFGTGPGQQGTPESAAQQPGSEAPAGSQQPGSTAPSVSGPTGDPAAAGGAGGDSRVAPPMTPGAVPPMAASASGSGPWGAPVAPAVGGSGDGQTPGAHTGPAADAVPVPAPMPFAAAVEAEKDKAAEPAFVVGQSVDEDLVLARTLLGGVLAAVGDTEVGLEWSVAVLRGPGGIGVFVTSNEGRGWMPAGLYLPQGVSTPWVWDLSDGSGLDAGASWEGVADPARILAEFGTVWGPKSGAKLSALVSSTTIDSSLRAELGSEVGVQDRVGPLEGSVDLSIPTGGVNDRLGVVGSPELVARVSEIPEERLSGRCAELAWDAHQRLAGTELVSSEISRVRALRGRLAAALRDGREIPEQWWEELRDADELLAVSASGRKVDVGQVAVGDLRAGAAEAATLRAMAFERRANELTLLLEGEQDRQTLRDVVYAFGQIVEHPLFGATAAETAAAEERQVAAAEAGTPAAPSAATTAPRATAAPTVSGPPTGAVVPPSVTPPAVTPPNVTPPTAL